MRTYWGENFLCDQPLVRKNINSTITSFVLELRLVHLLTGGTHQRPNTTVRTASLNTILYANTTQGESPRHLPPFPKLMHTGLIIRGRAATLDFYVAQWRNHHLLFTMEPIANTPTKISSIEGQFLWMPSGWPIARMSVIVVLTPADESKNRKWICKVKKALTARPIWPGNWMTMRNLWVVNLAEIWNPGGNGR